MVKRLIIGLAVLFASPAFAQYHYLPVGEGIEVSDGAVVTAHQSAHNSYPTCDIDALGEKCIFHTYFPNSATAGSADPLWTWRIWWETTDADADTACFAISAVAFPDNIRVDSYTPTLTAAVSDTGQGTAKRHKTGTGNITVTDPTGSQCGAGGASCSGADVWVTVQWTNSGCTPTIAETSIVKLDLIE